MNQNFGVLRVVRVKPARSAVNTTNTLGKYPTGWLPEDGLVHVLSHYETSIGRALSNDIILTVRIREVSPPTDGSSTLARYRPVSLPEQPEPEQEAQAWEAEEEESVLGAGVTMQFALPQRMGLRTRWLIAGIGIAILTISAMITIILNTYVGSSALHEGVLNIVAALTIPLVPAIGINLLVNFMDRFEREPWFLRLAAFLWGAIIAIPPALFIEQNVDTFLQNAFDPNNTSEVMRVVFQGLNAGITEETIKGVGL